MAKRKKYPKLPNGYGSIKYLGKGRRNPYAVHPPTTEFDIDGVPQTPKALCYVDDWIKGFAVLTAYKAGTYQPGMEKELTPDLKNDSPNIIQRILADYSLVKGVEQSEQGKTFSDIFKEYYLDRFKHEYKYKGKKSSMEQCMSAAFKNCAELYDKEFISLVANDLQKVIDDCPLKHSSLELIVTLFHQMYRYARKNNLCKEDYSQFVKIGIEDDDEHGVPFSDCELSTLWKHKDDKMVEMILIMCYSGFRLAAYKTLKIDMDEKYFQGGVKTKASKNRIVPIHSGIYELVKHRLEYSHTLLDTPATKFRESMYRTLEDIGIEKHTPHDCRHTFSRLCEKYRVSENDRKRMLGHAFSDITNSVYGHRELEDLREEIEKIKICY